MIETSDFFKPLIDFGYNYYTGVPCSFFKSAINYTIENEKTEFYMASNEGAAIAMGAGAYLAGNKAVIMMQNSGFGNSVSPLTSLNMIYNIPAMVFVSGRGYQVQDEPQHEIIGAQMTEILDSMKLKWQIIPDILEQWNSEVIKAEQYIKENQQPFIWIARKGLLGKYGTPFVNDKYPMKRMDAIDFLAGDIQKNFKDAVIFATTGMIGRELYALKDNHKNFYMMGSMGHIGAMALGFNQTQKHRKTFVFDGDGAMIMHSGILSTIGHYQPKNFYHIVLDNNVHGSTGNQKTTSDTTDFNEWAKKSGYRSSYSAKNIDELKSVFTQFSNSESPAFLRVFLNSEGHPNPPRITESYSAADITRNFLSEMQK